jgi:putative tricarboxylic transport membrane protein
MSLQRRDALRFLGVGAVAGLGAALSLRSRAASAPWLPTQSISYEIGVAAGGSADIYARGIKSALETLKLTNGQPVIPENRPGAAGLVALQQLQRSRGNAHLLATFHTASIAGQATGALKTDLREFVPVAMLVEETTLVAVPADSRLRSGKDLIDALKRDPAGLRVAVAPLLGLSTHLAIAKPLKVAGVDVRKMTVVPFRSSAESMTALLGGHVDVVSATGPLVVPMVQAGKVRMLASAAPERGTGPLGAVATWREQGVAADYVSYNGVLLPPAVDADQIHFWEDALRQVSAFSEWTRLVGQSGNKPIFKGYVDSHRYLQREIAETQALVASLGLTGS